MTGHIGLFVGEYTDPSGVVNCIEATAAMGGGVFDGLKIFAIQTYVVLGSNFIPVPGAVGISEFLMYHGYAELLGDEASCSLAILSRGISFYTCSIISVFTVILGFILLQQKKNKGEKL